MYILVDWHSHTVDQTIFKKMSKNYFKELKPKMASQDTINGLTRPKGRTKKKKKKLSKIHPKAPKPNMAFQDTLYPIYLHFVDFTC